MSKSLSAPPPRRNRLLSQNPLSEDDWYLNACVGANTGAHDNSVGDSGGFQAAAEILLRLSRVATPPRAHEHWGANPIVDMLVYPICYCARHHAELVLKSALPKFWLFSRLARPMNLRASLSRSP